MLVNFSKMHGLGNDFVVLDCISQNLRLHSAHIRKIADRKVGIGCDQVLLIEPPMRPEADFYYRIFNPDGREVEQCGNGARCLAKFFFDLGLSDKKKIIADCLAGTLELTLEPHDIVKANMGTLQKKPQPISLTVASSDFPNAFDMIQVCLGNPHAVLLVDSIAEPIKKLGMMLSKHAHFANGANIGFMQILDRSHIRLRVYERGAGETLACGSGACAAVIAGQFLGLLDSQVEVILKLGSLKVIAKGLGEAIYLKGPAKRIFMGSFRI